MGNQEMLEGAISAQSIAAAVTPDGRHVVSGYEDLIRAVDGRAPANQSATSLWADFPESGPHFGTESIGFALRGTRSEQQVIERSYMLKPQGL